MPSETNAPTLDDWTIVSDDAEKMDIVILDGDRVIAAVAGEGRETHGEWQVTSDTARAGGTSTVPEGFLAIRLRYGERMRTAWFKPTELVDDFISEFFPHEVAQNKKVRLIYMGMLLMRGRSMGEYGIEEDGVIHSVITDSPQAHPESTQDFELKGLAHPTNTLLVVTGVGLYGFWTLFYNFPHLFSWKSLALLSAMSVGHLSYAVQRFAFPSFLHPEPPHSTSITS